MDYIRKFLSLLRSVPGWSRIVILLAGASIAFALTFSSCAYRSYGVVQSSTRHKVKMADSLGKSRVTKYQSDSTFIEFNPRSVK